MTMVKLIGSMCLVAILTLQSALSASAQPRADATSAPRLASSAPAGLLYGINLDSHDDSSDTGERPDTGADPDAEAEAGAETAGQSTAQGSRPWAEAAAVSSEVLEATIQGLQREMEAGRLTSQQLTQMYLDRIEALDHNGPKLRSIIQVNPDALEIAAALDRERAADGSRGPLHGIPILIKDNIDTADQMTTTAGSLALEGSIPPRDSFVVQQLRKAGAVLIGKTNLSEWANFRSTQSSSGWSGRGGQVLNPYVLDRNPCGSSSGSGTAVSANLATAALGTETDGSIVCPSSATGLVGLKPTLGLVSRSGIIPIAHSQDTAGPMARTVTDAAILLSAIVGSDPRDEATSQTGCEVHKDYTQFLKPDGLRGARIGIARNNGFGASPEADEIAEAAIAEMKRLGAVIVDPADIPHLDELGDPEFEVLLYEFKADLNKYLATLGPDQPKTLAELIEFNENHAEEEMPYFGQEIFLLAQDKGPLTDKAYRDALATAKRLSQKEGIDAVMDEHDLDALVAPTGSPAWPTDLINGDHFLFGSSSPAAVAGYPNITVPAGYSFGLPVGMSFFGRACSESTLLELAYSFEQGTKARRAPQFLPTLDLPNAMPSTGGGGASTKGQH